MDPSAQRRCRRSSPRWPGATGRRRGAARRGPASAIPLMTVENLTAPGLLQDISFTLARGEVLGVTGLAGSGLSELSRAVFGASGRQASGRVLIEGKPVPAGAPAASLNA